MEGEGSGCSFADSSLSLSRMRDGGGQAMPSAIHTPPLYPPVHIVPTTIQHCSPVHLLRKCGAHLPDSPLCL